MDPGSFYFSQINNTHFTSFALGAYKPIFETSPEEIHFLLWIFQVRMSAQDVRNLWWTPIHVFSTHLGWCKVAAILQTPFSNWFPCMKSVSILFQICLFLRVRLMIKRNWFRYWLGTEQATSHYLNQWWPSLLTHAHIVHSALTCWYVKWTHL